MNRKQRAKRYDRRRAHALRLDNRRPKGSPLLSVLRREAKAARRKEAA